MPLLRNNIINKIFETIFKKNTNTSNDISNNIYTEQTIQPIEYIIPEKSEVVPIRINPRKNSYKESVKQLFSDNSSDLFAELIINLEKQIDSQNTLSNEYFISENSELVPIKVNPRNSFSHKKILPRAKTSKQKSLDSYSNSYEEQENKVTKTILANNISLSNLLENILEESTELEELIKLLGE